MKKILLHICCGPCAIYPLEVLRSKGFQVSGFFYNPNIHPVAEYLKRKEAAEILSDKEGLGIFYHDYDIENFFRSISGKEKFGERCRICWRIRLLATAEFAKKNGFEYFTTTLLVSPYQNQDEIKRIAEDIATGANAKFHYEDFRPGFKKAHEISKKMGLYHQKYCGCVYSEKERPNIKYQKSNIKMTHSTSLRVIPSASRGMTNQNSKI